MFRIKDAKTGGLIEEVIWPIWVKQQKLVDFPIACNSLEEADGLYLSDDNTLVGIAGKKMENYKPNVIVEEFDGEPYLFDKVHRLQKELEEARDENKQLQLDTMQGTADLYLTEQENKQLQLDTMQGLADLYALQTEGGV